jgi:DNA-binding CsgD family transcriptional regulator
MRPGTLTTPADAAVAGVLTVLAQLEVWAPRLVPGVNDVVTDRPVLAVTALAATLPLAVRRSFPLGVLLTVLAALVLQQALATPTEGLTLLMAGMLAAYSSSAYAPVPRAAAAGAAVVVATAFIGSNPGDWVFLAVVLGVAWLLGMVVAQRSVELADARADNLDLAEQLAAATRMLAESQRHRPTGAAPDDLAMLTPRELEVVRSVATGRSNAEIADQLVISEWTVKTHVASVLRKLGLRDRAQVVVAAYESGFVRPARPGNGTDTDAGR